MSAPHHCVLRCARDDRGEEKLVTRHILEQTRRDGDDLAAVKTRLDRVERKVDDLDRKFDDLERKFDGLGGRFDDQTRSLPRIVGDVMREVLSERGEK